MADSTIYTIPDNNSAMYAAMANGANGNWMNNPFVYLMMLPFLYGMTGNGWGNNVNRGMTVGQGLADVGLSNQIQNLSNQMTDNLNSNLTMGAINSTTGAVRDNGVALNAGVDTINSGIYGLNTAINQQGFQNQLANCQLTNTILLQAQGINNTVQNGFTQLGFQLERNACDVKETSTANTQKIVDTLNNKWSTDSAAKITQLEDQLATLQQTNALIAALGGNATKLATA